MAEKHQNGSAYTDKEIIVSGDDLDIFADVFTLELTGLGFKVAASASLSVVVGASLAFEGGAKGVFTATTKLMAELGYCLTVNAMFAANTHLLKGTMVVDEISLTAEQMKTQLNALEAASATIETNTAQVVSGVTRTELDACQTNMVTVLEAEVLAAQAEIADQVNAVTGQKATVEGVKNQVVAKSQEVAAAQTEVAAAIINVNAKISEATAAAKVVTGATNTTLAPLVTIQ